MHSTISRDRSKGVAALAEENFQFLAKRHERSNPLAATPIASDTTSRLIEVEETRIPGLDRDPELDRELDREQRRRLERERIWKQATTRSLDFFEAPKAQYYLTRELVLEHDMDIPMVVSDFEEHDAYSDGGGIDKSTSPLALFGGADTVHSKRRKRKKRSKNIKSTLVPLGIKKPRIEVEKLPSMPVFEPDNRPTPPLPDSKHYRIVYSVTCYESDAWKGGHTAKFFDDKPVYDSSKSFHLDGSCPHSFIENVADEKAFIVFRDYNCINPSVHQHQVHSLTPKVTESIDIRSPILRSAFREVATYSPGDSFNKEWRLIGPPIFICHHRDALLRYAERNQDGCMDIIRDLLEYIDTEWADSVSALQRSEKDGTIDTKHLNWLYKPNEMIILVSDGLPTAYVLKSPPMLASDPTDLILCCWSWGYDGFSLSRNDLDLVFTIPSASGPVPITSLPFYPMRFATEKVVDTIIARGRKFWGLRYQHHVSYSGWDAKAEEYYTAETRCILDYRTYKKFYPKSEDLKYYSTPSQLIDHWDRSVSRESDLSKENLMLLPQKIHGFVLKNKNWTLLLVDNIEPVKWNKDAFDRLVVRPSTKEMIKALVMVRIMKREGKRVVDLSRKRDDIIAGKGNGLIMLLHGGPGTGKTLTAESVAEIAEMPLYRVTCGEIGTTANAVEKYLETILHLGKEWNCVLLLDEADVFLEERSMSDLQRNSLVSVFLRILEYYDGILILTTNRVGSFDEAFQSRIQVAIHYPTLTFPSRKRIWENFFSLLVDEEQSADVDELRRHIEQLAGHEMNGRQIRNILTTARQLALYKQETMTWKHVDQAITTAKDFTQYLQNVHGHTDDQWAREEKLR